MRASTFVFGTLAATASAQFSNTTTIAYVTQTMTVTVCSDEVCQTRAITTAVAATPEVTKVPVSTDEDITSTIYAYMTVSAENQTSNYTSPSVAPMEAKANNLYAHFGVAAVAGAAAFLL